MDHARAQLVVLGQILKFGTSAVLRRGATDRPCIAGELIDKARSNDRRAAGSRTFLVAAVLVGGTAIVAPDHEQDKLVFNGEVFTIPAPVKKLAPAGVAHYYELEVLFQSTE